MGLSAVYLGRQSWQDFIDAHSSIRRIQDALAQRAAREHEVSELEPSIQVALGEGDYQIALESGLGALGGADGFSNDGADYTIEVAFDKLAGGIDKLNADFNLLLGDAIWKLEMH